MEPSVTFTECDETLPGSLIQVYPGQLAAQTIYLYLYRVNRHMLITTSDCHGPATELPEGVRAGLVRRYRLPALTTKEANGLMRDAEVQLLAGILCDTLGETYAIAALADEGLTRICADFWSEIQIVDAFEYFSSCSDIINEVFPALDISEREIWMQSVAADRDLYLLDTQSAAKYLVGK